MGEQITTGEQLNALPERSVIVLPSTASAFQKIDGRWAEATTSRTFYPAELVTYRLRERETFVVWTPESKEWA